MTATLIAPTRPATGPLLGTGLAATALEEWGGVVEPEEPARAVVLLTDAAARARGLGEDDDALRCETLAGWAALDAAKDAAAEDDAARCEEWARHAVEVRARLSSEP